MDTINRALEAIQLGEVRSLVARNASLVAILKQRVPEIEREFESNRFLIGLATSGWGPEDVMEYIFSRRPEIEARLQLTPGGKEWMRRQAADFLVLLNGQA